MSCCGCFHALCSYAFATNILTWILANRFHKNSWQQQGEHEHVYVLLNFFCFWRFYHTFHNIMFCLKLDIYKSEYQNVQTWKYLLALFTSVGWIWCVNWYHMPVQILTSPTRHVAFLALVSFFHLIMNISLVVTQISSCGKDFITCITFKMIFWMCF